MKLIRYASVFIILTAIGILYDKYKKKWSFLDSTYQNEQNIQNYLLNEKSILNGKPSKESTERCTIFTSRKLL